MLRNAINGVCNQKIAHQKRGEKMNTPTLIWLVALTLLYVVQSAFAVNAQSQINDLEKRKQNRFNLVAKETDDKADSPTDSTE